MTKVGEILVKNYQKKLIK